MNLDLTPEQFAGLWPRVLEAEPFSDADYDDLLILAATLQVAQSRHPGAPVLEIGTRAGGSAYLMLLLLLDWHGAAAPMVVTVDPYGQKPQPLDQPLYAMTHYVTARTLLARFPNHTHFLMTSEHFLALPLDRIGYWTQGILCPYQDFGFAYVDGDHAYDTVALECEQLLRTRLLRSGGMVMIDNIDQCPGIETRVVDLGATEIHRVGRAKLIVEKP